MAIFTLEEVSLPNGGFAAEWFDDEQCLWDDVRLHRAARVLSEWKTPDLRLHRGARAATSVLFNPEAYAVADSIRQRLQHIRDVEFLPVDIANVGRYFLLHVVAACSLPASAVVRRAAPPSGNIIFVDGFPPNVSIEHAFFRFRQPSDSAAGRAGSLVRGIFLGEVGAHLIEEVAGGFLRARKLPDA